ncbi:MAG: hypothetical protein RI894_1385 [Bacteroidota bacterium]|jgi:inner membrane protein
MAEMHLPPTPPDNSPPKVPTVMAPLPPPPPPSKWSDSIILKAIIISFLGLILLIPTSLVSTIIYERESYRNEAIRDVGDKWGGTQNIVGPVVSVPYSVPVTDEETKKTVFETHYAHFLPEKLQLKGSLVPETRKRGIYDVVVYSSKLHIEGVFSALNFTSLGVKSENIDGNAAQLDIGISDLRGIDKMVSLTWNGAELPFNSGLANADIAATGIHANVPIGVINNEKGNFSFAIDLDLKGSDLIHFAPVGKITDITLNSVWPNPSFDGGFLPDDRKVSDKGFDAHWNILHLNRAYPQSFTDAPQGLDKSLFGVSLMIPIDSYAKSTRAVKYGILFIALTFLTFFFIEVLNKKKVHPFQYILVGLALCLFYTLLVAISEQTSFNFAYFISASATILLISGYVRAILDNMRLGAIVACILSLLYGFIFIILQLEGFALLVGSVGLFAVLSAVMYYSRKIDWYNVNEKG